MVSPDELRSMPFVTQKDLQAQMSACVKFVVEPAKSQTNTQWLVQTTHPPSCAPMPTHKSKTTFHTSTEWDTIAMKECIVCASNHSCVPLVVNPFVEGYVTAICGTCRDGI